MKKTCLMIGLALAIAFVSSAPAAAQTVEVVQGASRLTLNPQLITALTALGITPSANSPASLHNGVLTLPVTVGVADLSQPQLEIEHSGGLTLTNGQTTIVARDFHLEVSNGKAIVTTFVSKNGKAVGRVHFLDAVISSISQNERCFLTIQYAALTLSDTSATSLNSDFSVTAFVAGFPMAIGQTYSFVAHK